MRELARPIKPWRKRKLKQRNLRVHGDIHRGHICLQSCECPLVEWWQFTVVLRNQGRYTKHRMSDVAFALETLAYCYGTDLAIDREGDSWKVVLGNYKFRPPFVDGAGFARYQTPIGGLPDDV